MDWDPFALDPIPVHPSSNDQNDISTTSGGLEWPGETNNEKSEGVTEPSPSDWPTQSQTSDQGIINQGFFANNNVTSDNDMEKIEDDTAKEPATTAPMPTRKV